MIAGGRFVRLDTARHDRKGFDCGRDELDGFLRERADKHSRQGVSRTWVLPDPGGVPDPAGRVPIAAFYTLTIGSVDRDDLPDDVVRKLPRWPVPVFLIGQLAVAEAFHGQGLGQATLVAAFRRLAALHDQVPAVAVVVDCLDDAAASFYASRDFLAMNAPGPRPRMFFPMAEVLDLVANA